MSFADHEDFKGDVMPIPHAEVAALAIRYSAKLDAYRGAFNELAQAYHTLCNITNNDRHVAKDWKTCNEQTCANARIMVDKIESM